MHLQEIACTRSFGHAVTQLQELQEAFSEFASRAAEKLRKQSSHACQVQVFIRTSPFRVQDLQFSRSVVVPLRRPTDDSRDISQAALMGLTRIFAPGYSYAKAGVMLLSLQEASQIQHELQLEDEKTERRTARPFVPLDANARYRQQTIWAWLGPLGQCRTLRRPAELGHETGAPDTGIHHLLGRNAHCPRLNEYPQFK